MNESFAVGRPSPTPTPRVPLLSPPLLSSLHSSPLTLDHYFPCSPTHSSSLPPSLLFFQRLKWMMLFTTTQQSNAGKANVPLAKFARCTHTHTHTHMKRAGQAHSRRRVPHPVSPNGQPSSTVAPSSDIKRRCEPTIKIANE